MLQVPEEMRPSWTLSLEMLSLKEPSYKAVPTQAFPMAYTQAWASLSHLVHCLPVFGKDFL